MTSHRVEGSGEGVKEGKEVEEVEEVEEEECEVSNKDDDGDDNQEAHDGSVRSLRISSCSRILERNHFYVFSKSCFISIFVYPFVFSKT